MTGQEERREVSFKALCAIALRELRTAPTIDDLEWKERIRDRVHRDGFLTPLAETVWRAMDQIERAHPRLHQRRTPTRNSRRFSDLLSRR